MNKQKINSVQFLSMFFFIIDAPLTGINLTILFKQAGINAYLSILLAAFISIILLLMFKYIYNYKPELALQDKIIHLFGKKIGFFMNIILILLVRIFATIMFYILIDFIISQYLPSATSKIIGIVIATSIIYTTTKGIEVISRMSFLLFIFCLIIFVITFIGIFPSINFSNFKPFLELGLSKPLLSALNIILINYIPLFTLLCVPKKQIIDNNKFNKALIIIYIITTFIMMLTIISIIGNLDIPLATIYEYPEYALLKRVNLFNFLDRIENILAMQRLIKMYLFICILTYFISHTLDKTNTKKYIIVFIVISFFTSSHLFRTNTHFNTFITNYLYIFRLLFLILILIILLKIIKKKHSN